MRAGRGGNAGRNKPCPQSPLLAAPVRAESCPIAGKAHSNGQARCGCARLLSRGSLVRIQPGVLARLSANCLCEEPAAAARRVGSSISSGMAVIRCLTAGVFLCGDQVAADGCLAEARSPAPGRHAGARPGHAACPAPSCLTARSERLCRFGQWPTGTPGRGSATAACINGSWGTRGARPSRSASDRGRTIPIRGIRAYRSFLVRGTSSARRDRAERRQHPSGLVRV